MGAGRGRPVTAGRSVRRARGPRRSALPGYTTTMTGKTDLDLPALLKVAAEFAREVSSHPQPGLFGVDNGKAIGTAVEHQFRAKLLKSYSFTPGNSARGIDFPELKVDMKVTSVVQPQSSCPFRSASQKIYGLGYGLLVFAYEKADDPKAKAAILNVRRAVYVRPERTGDFTTTRVLRQTLEAGGNAEDLVAVMLDRNLPLDEVEATGIAERLLTEPCEQGYLTISNALQWRLQYGRVVNAEDPLEGVERIK